MKIISFSTVKFYFYHKKYIKLIKRLFLHIEILHLKEHRTKKLILRYLLDLEIYDKDERWMILRIFKPKL